MTTEPAPYNLVIYQGANLSQQFIWKDSTGALVNLTGYTARMMARVNVNSATPFISLTTENSGIALGGTAGTITLSMTAAQTAAINETVGFYDLELVSGGGIVTRFLQGMVTISREITR
jgi:hypothetical protein